MDEVFVTWALAVSADGVLSMHRELIFTLGKHALHMKPVDPSQGDEACWSSKQTWGDLIDFLHYQSPGEAANASYATAVGDGTKHALYGMNTLAASNVVLD